MLGKGFMQDMGNMNLEDLEKKFAGMNDSSDEEDEGASKQSIMD